MRCPKFFKVFAIALALVATGPVFANETAGEVYLKAEALRLNATSDEDLTTALKLFRKAADMGKGGAYYRIGAIELHFGRKQEAMKAWEKASGIGSASAKILLAKTHATGGFGEHSDPSKGVPVLEGLANDPAQKRAIFALAELLETGSGTKKDAPRAVSLFQALAETGDPRAQRKVGRYYLRGFPAGGITMNLETAENWMKRAAAGGSKSAQKDLGQVYILMGQSSNAFEALQTSVAQGVPGAEADLANGHYRKLFAEQSDVNKGRRDLKTLAEGGDVYAARHALRHHERKSRRLKELDHELVVQKLWAASKAGDRIAPTVLSRFYRRLDWMFADEKEKLAELVEQFPAQLGPSGVAADKITIMYDKDDHRTSRRAAVDFIQDLKGPEYVAAALRLRSIERTSFVYLVQSELKKLGYYNAQVSGVAGRKTLQAMLDYCAANGALSECLHGPLLFSTSKLVAEFLADDERRL